MTKDINLQKDAVGEDMLYIQKKNTQTLFKILRLTNKFQDSYYIKLRESTRDSQHVLPFKIQTVQFPLHLITCFKIRT